MDLAKIGAASITTGWLPSYHDGEKFARVYIDRDKANDSRHDK